MEEKRPIIQTGCFDPSGKGRRYVRALPLELVPRRIRYRFSKTNVQPPSGWNPQDMTRSGRLPDRELKCGFVFGFADDPSTSEFL